MLAGMEKNKGQRLGGDIALPPDGNPRLAEIGISKAQSHRWQAVAGKTRTATPKNSQNEPHYHLKEARAICA